MFEVTVTGGERVRAFVPLALPPRPPLALDGPLRSTLEAAAISLGRLDGMSTLLPDHTLFIYVYIRKEAVLSSQIEGAGTRAPPTRTGFPAVEPAHSGNPWRTAVARAG